jgi:hypothetical protein
MRKKRREVRFPYLLSSSHSQCTHLNGGTSRHTSSWRRTCWMILYLFVFSLISLILSVFVIVFIFYQSNLRLFDQLSLHLALADLFTTIPVFLSQKYFEPSPRCQYQVYLHQFGIINKAIVILTIASLVVYIVKTARLPNPRLHLIGYLLWFVCVVSSITLLITFNTASIFCDDEDVGHVTNIYHDKPTQLIVYLLCYSMILLFCGIGSALMLLSLYLQIASVWVNHESFQRSKLRFLIQRLKWYPIVFLVGGIPQVLFVLIILVSNKNPQVLLVLDLLGTPFLGISLSLVYLYWTLHNYYQQLFHENHPEVTSFSSYYGGGGAQRPAPSRNSSLFNPNDYFSLLIVAFLTCLHSLLSPAPSPPINETDDLTSISQHIQPPLSSGQSSTTSSQQNRHLHSHLLSNNSSPLSSDAPSINSHGIPRSSLSDPVANEVQLASSFSFKNRLSRFFEHEGQGEGSRYHPTRVSLLDRSFILEQSIREDQEFKDESSLPRETESHQKESISLSFLMNLTSGHR